MPTAGDSSPCVPTLSNYTSRTQHFSMRFDRLIALLPCQSLEEFDLDRRDNDAEQLLAAWSALWHPALLADARALPGWLPAVCPPTEFTNHLIVVPDCCAGPIPDDWHSAAEQAGACVARGFSRRDEIVAAALDRLAPDRRAVAPELAADFLALGYCHFQIEILTRKLRYMSNLDEAGLRDAAVAAADAALCGDAAETRRHLQAAFDRLHEAREYFYPVEPRLLDLTLAAPSTIGQTLREELSSAQPINLLLDGETLEAMARQEPETLEALRRALESGAVALLGGERRESPLPMLAPEAIRERLVAGQAVYEKHLGRRPAVFGRRRFGLAPVLPSILRRLGFLGAFHCTLDDGQFPVGNQSRIEWEGFDRTAIEAIGCIPLDAGRAATFLSLATKLADAMSLDHASTLMLAHWPGGACCWHEDLRRIAAYGAVLGRFLTVTAYFDETQLAGTRTAYRADQYRSPYLRQDAAAGRRDPISRWVRYYDRRARLDAAAALELMVAVCAWAKETVSDENATPPQPRRKSEDWAALADRIEERRDSPTDADSALDAALQSKLDESLAGFSQAIARDAESSHRGTLLVNPSSFSRLAEISCAPPEAVSAPVEVPAMGFTWVDPRAAPERTGEKKRGWLGLRRAKEPPPLAEENILRNEYFEIRFDPATGAIRAIYDYHSRGPRLAQQIAFRETLTGIEPDDDAHYTVMAADALEVAASGSEVGEMVCRGRLLDREGGRIAGFRQTTRVRRGSRVIELLVELAPERTPDANPWNSYYAARFAWKDETASVHRCVNLANVPTELPHFESPWFVDIRRDRLRTTLLCGGLPYHRRVGLRKLDTLLIVRGETARRFRLGIALDAPSPTAAALGFLAPPSALPDAPPPAAPSGWLFHLDCRNVLATHWEPVGGTAFRVRLLETDGRGAPLRLRCFRNVASARMLGADNSESRDLAFEGDRVDIPIGPHEWCEAEIALQPR